MDIRNKEWDNREHWHTSVPISFCDFFNMQANPSSGSMSHSAGYILFLFIHPPEAVIHKSDGSWNQSIFRLGSLLQRQRLATRIVVVFFHLTISSVPLFVCCVGFHSVHTELIPIRNSQPNLPLYPARVVVALILCYSLFCYPSYEAVVAEIHIASHHSKRRKACFKFLEFKGFRGVYMTWRVLYLGQSV